jgi:hypothetical protein
VLGVEKLQHKAEVIGAVNGKSLVGCSPRHNSALLRAE